MKVEFKDLLSRSETFLVITIFIALLFIMGYIFFTPNYYQGNSPVKFDIKKGEPFSQVVDRLFINGIIPSKSNFRIAAFFYGAEKRVRAARYYIPNGLSYLDLLDLFINGDCNFARKVVIGNGATINWIASKLQWQVYIDSVDFINKANDTDFLQSLGHYQPSLEGYLFPEEYEVYEHSSPEEVITLFYKGNKDFFVDSLKRRCDELGYSIHEILTLASIVEGETNLVQEMPKIAGVYHNRLNRGMKLQADPTIQYLLPGGWRRLLYKDLEIDSPYNTYMYEGLPPAPINNPRKDAIIAALYPEQHNYLYFVSNGNGGHKFSRTHSGHLKNVREYRRWLKSQNQLQ